MFHARKWVAFLVLVAFCISTLPIPVFHLDPSPSDDSVAYPCQSGHCGCKSAFQCWTSCCCQTPEERLEWARKNGASPPSYAILKSPSQPKSVANTASKKSPCCDTLKSCSSPVAHEKAAAPAEACQSDTVVAPEKNQRWLLVMDALKCQGKSSTFSMLPWTILATPITWTCTLAFSGNVTGPGPNLFVDTSVAPATPPPRF